MAKDIKDKTYKCIYIKQTYQITAHKKIELNITGLTRKEIEEKEKEAMADFENKVTMDIQNMNTDHTEQYQHEYNLIKNSVTEIIQ